MRKKLLILLIVILFASPLPLPAQEQSTYTNDEFGLQMTGPQGWSLISGKDIKEEKFDKPLGREKILAMFLVPQKQWVDCPNSRQKMTSVFNIVLDVAESYHEMPRASEYAQFYLNVRKIFYGEVNIIESPAPVVVNGRQGVRCTYTFLKRVGPAVWERYLATKSTTYIFVDDKRAFTVSGSDSLCAFDSYKADFESAINTLVIKVLKRKVPEEWGNQ